MMINALKCIFIYQALRTHSGNQRPSSPPAWFHETADMWPNCNRATPGNSYQKNIGCNNKRTKLYNPESYSSDEKNNFGDVERNQRRYAPDRNDDEAHSKLNNLNCVEPLNHQAFETVMRRQPTRQSPNSSSVSCNGINGYAVYKNPALTPECNQSPSEFFDSGLDAVETPNDDTLNTGNLDIPFTNQNSFSNKDSCTRTTHISNMQRPRTLNLPHEQSFSDELQCLKCKQHQPNKDGNVYVEPSKTITQVLHVGHLESSNRFSDGITTPQFIGGTGAGTPYCHTSMEVGEHGTKDEGYSTMSSDIQAGELIGQSADNPNDYLKPSICNKHAMERKVTDTVNKEEMKEIYEEDEAEDNCSNFARELANSVVRQSNDDNMQQAKSNPKTTMELLNSRSSNLINLFSPQGFKSKTEKSPSESLTSGGDIFNCVRSGNSKSKGFEVAANDQTSATKAASAQNCNISCDCLIHPTKYISRRDAKQLSSLCRTSSDSKIYIDWRQLCLDNRQTDAHKMVGPPCGNCKAVSGMTQSHDGVFGTRSLAAVSSIRRSRCQILNRLKNSLSSSHNEVGLIVPLLLIYS